METDPNNGNIRFRAKRLPWVCLTLLALALVLSSGCSALPKFNHTQTDKNALAEFEKAVSKLYLSGDNVPAELLIPQEIGEPSTTEFHSYTTAAYIFESRAYTLLCRYDEAEYAKEKAALETRYSFRTEPVYSEDTLISKNAKELEPEFDIGGDHFRFIMPNDEYEGYMGVFFKGCSLVVTNDERHEIAYIVYKDTDLDVADDLVEFVNDTCGWKYVR